MLFKLMPGAANVTDEYSLRVLTIASLNRIYQKSMLSVDNPLPFMARDGGIRPAIVLRGIPKSLHH